MAIYIFGDLYSNIRHYSTNFDVSVKNIQIIDI